MMARKWGVPQTGLFKGQGQLRSLTSFRKGSWSNVISKKAVFT